MSRRAKQKKWRTEEEERRHEKGERRWRRRRRRKENPSTLEKRASSLGCESRTCAKPALTAKLPFSTSVFPLILSTSVYYVYSLARARSSKKVWRFAWKSFLFFSKSSFLRSSRMIKRTRNWHLANFHLMTSFFFWWAPREDDENCFSSSVSFVYGCVYVVVRKMDDGRLASVVVYNLH